MKIIPTSIAGVVTIQTTMRTDHRGEFARLFCERELAQPIGAGHIVQANRSLMQAEVGISPTDPSVGIDWPHPIVDLSEKNKAHPHLSPDFDGIAV